MEIDQLVHFLKVAETENITRAAESLRLSQPAVSRSLQKLEDEIGRTLFERQTRRMVLTEAGELLVRRARQVLAILEDTQSELADDGQSGRLRLAAIPTIAPYFLPGILKAFSKRFPLARLTVQEDTTNHLLHRLAQGEIDIAILALPVQAKYLECQELFKEELLLVVAAEHPLVDKKQIRIADVEPFPFVLLDEAHCLSDSIVSFCRQRSFQPVSVERTSQLATVQELVSLNHGVSMVPAMAQRIDKCKERIYRSLTGNKPSRVVAAFWNPYRFQSRLQKEFLQALVSYSQEFAIVT